MLKNINKHKWFLISLVLTIVLICIRYSHSVVQQDNYLGYSQHLPFGVKDISFYDSRLFPGLPILIYLANLALKNVFISGYLITLAAFAGSYIFLYKITKSPLSVLPLIFPPILLNLASLIDTEFPFIFLTILGIWAIKKRRYWLGFLVIGFSVWFRLSGIAVLGGVLIYLFLEKKTAFFFKNIIFFLLPIALFMLYNYFFYGSGNLFYQIFTYEALHPARINIGLIQLLEDLVRALRWHWYRIFFSGLFYIIFYSWLWLKSFKTKTLEFWIITLIYFYVLSVNLVPFLENLGRYLAPAIPIFWIMFHKEAKNNKYFYLLLPLSFLSVAF